MFSHVLNLTHLLLCCTYLCTRGMLFAHKEYNLFLPTSMTILLGDTAEDKSSPFALKAVLSS